VNYVYTVQVDWSRIDSAVTKLRSLTKLPIKMDLSLRSDPAGSYEPSGIDEQEPELQELMTRRVLQLMERLAPLSKEEQFGGIREVCIKRSTVGEAELAALGAAVGHTCRVLTFNGLPEGPQREHTAAIVPKYFPHVEDLQFRA
jgi:hypothetical protein